MRPLRILFAAPSLLLALLPMACGGDGSAARVERADSAGVEVVINRGGDRPLEWGLERVLELGGRDEGPEAFFNVSHGALAADGDALHVLDRGNHRVVTFDDAGRHVRTMGRKGGGPGELQWPQSLVLAGDGTLVIGDIGHRGLVRLTRDGEALEHRILEGWRGGRMDRYGDGLLVQVDAGDPHEASEQLVHLAGDERTPVLAVTGDPLRPVDFGCVRISGMAQLFAPSLTWATGADRLAVARDAAYQIDVYSGRDLVRRIRRDVPPRPATLELAVQEVGEKFEVQFGSGGSCVVEPEKVVEERGFADVVPAIRRVAVAPDGTLWVQRFVVKGEEPPIDLFADDGAYLGTLPAGTPFPAAFFAPDRFATTEKDELDVDHVVVYRVTRR